jgi:hypothetical protein
MAANVSLLLMARLSVAQAQETRIQGQPAYVCFNMHLNSGVSGRVCVSEESAPKVSVLFEPPNSIEVQDVLAYRGTANASELEWTLVRPVLVPGGMVSLTPGPIKIRSMAPHGHDVVTTVDLPTSAPNRRTSIRAEGVVIPRNALRITCWRDVEGFRGDRWAPALKGERWIAGEGLLSIHAAPDSETVVRLHIPVPETVPLVVANKKGHDWWRVKQVLRDGTAIRGWVNVRALRPWDPKAPVNDQVEPRTPPEPVGCDNAFLSRNEGPLVRARLVVGSSIYTRPHGEPWATVAKPVEVEAVLLPAEPEWARIKDILNMAADCDLGRFVLRNTLDILPPEKNR